MKNKRNKNVRKMEKTVEKLNKHSAALANR